MSFAHRAPARSIGFPAFIFALVLAPAAPPLVAADVNLAQLEAAHSLLLQGKTADAQAAFEAVAEADPRNPRAVMGLATIALQRGEHEKAVHLLEQGVRLAPLDSEFHRALGDAYGHLAMKASVWSKWGLARKCLAAYRRAVELDPKNLNARYCLFEFYRQAPRLIGGGTERAAAEAAAIKQLDPERGRFAFAMLYTTEKKYDLAFAQFDEVLRTAPDDYGANYQIGRLAALTGRQLDRGLASLRRCLALTPPAGQPGHAFAHWQTGLIFEKEGDPASARVAYEAALELEPNLEPAAEALKRLKS
jgi:tetratricopeptide (TPR) repeat protein